MVPYLSSWLSMQSTVARAATESIAGSANVMLALSPQPASQDASAAFGPDAVKVTDPVDAVKEGYELSFTREVTPELIDAFADVSGDKNPLHLDDAYATRTQFGGRIAHGFLSAGFISAALSRMPGIVVYVSQNMRFTKPVKPGDRVTATVRVTEKPAGKKWTRLSTVCALEDGTPVLEGEAKVLLLPEKSTD